jgi:hypothetical protein
MSCWISAPQSLVGCPRVVMSAVLNTLPKSSRDPMLADCAGEVGGGGGVLTAEGAVEG